jgi:predicted nucleic acid-binding protein
MSAAQKPTYYIDTMILVYYLKKNYDKARAATAKNFLKKIEDGYFNGVISTLAIGELIKVLREIMVEHENVTLPKDWQEEIKRGLQTIYGLKNVKLVKNFITASTGQPVTLDYVSTEGLRIIDTYPGKTERNSRGDPVHDGCHIMDTYHIVLAKELGCSKIATFDNDYVETKHECDALHLQRDYW